MARASRSSTSADGAPPRPCSSQVYQVALTLARCATSSRRSPGVRLRVNGKPNAAGSSLARRSFRYVPSKLSVAGGMLILLVDIPVYRHAFPQMVSATTLHLIINQKGVVMHVFVTGATGFI